ncbi:tyrosine-type recombinase/integrase [Halomonas shantousis]
MPKHTEKLTNRAIERLSKTLPVSDEVWDTELSGFHVRAGKRGLSFRLSYYNSTGTRRVITLGRNGVISASEAREKAKAALAQNTQGEDPRETQTSRKGMQASTLRDYLTGPYKEYQDRRKDGKKTLRRIERDFEGLLDRPMASLCRADIEDWQKAEERKAKPRAFTTLQLSYAALCGLLSHAADRKAISEHPLRGVKLHKRALENTEGNAQGRCYLTEAEVEALFKGLEAYQEQKREQRRSSRAHGKSHLVDLDTVAYVDHVMPWILTMYYSGFRPGDIYGLQWEHINFELSIIRKVIEKTEHYTSAPKTFPIHKKLKTVLETWHKQRGEPNTGLVFPSFVTGKRLNNTAMMKPWKKVKELGGLSDSLVLYSLRHNFASQLVMAGIDLLTVANLLGHTDVTMVVRHYGHLKPDHIANALESVF